MTRIQVGWAIKHVDEGEDENGEPQTIVWWEVFEMIGPAPENGIPLYVEDGPDA